MNIYPFSLRQLGYSKQKIPPQKTVSPCAECVTFSKLFKNFSSGSVLLLDFSVLLLDFRTVFVEIKLLSLLYY